MKIEIPSGKTKSTGAANANAKHRGLQCKRNPSVPLEAD